MCLSFIWKFKFLLLLLSRYALRRSACVYFLILITLHVNLSIENWFFSLCDHITTCYISPFAFRTNISIQCCHYSASSYFFPSFVWAVMKASSLQTTTVIRWGSWITALWNCKMLVSTRNILQSTSAYKKDENKAKKRNKWRKMRNIENSKILMWVFIAVNIYMKWVVSSWISS